MESARPGILVDGRPLLDPRGGGVFDYASHLVQALRDDAALDLRVWANQASVPGPEALAVIDSLTRWPNKLLHAGIRFAATPKIDRLASSRPDLIWLPNLHFVAVGAGIPLALTVHDLSFERYPEFFSAKQRLWHHAIDSRSLCRRATVILAVSGHTKRDLVDLYGIPPERIVVTHPGVSRASDGADFSGLPALPDRFILHVGALEPRKNHLALLEAFRLLKSRPALKDLGLVLAGPDGWKNREILGTIAAHPFRPSIFRLGFVSAAAKRELYRRAAVFAFPSFYEGFGLPPLEAMAAGAPVVASFAASLGEVVGDAGILTDPYRPAELAEALAAVIDSPSLASMLRQRGSSRAASFTWQACEKKTAAAFMAAIS